MTTRGHEGAVSRGRAAGAELARPAVAAAATERATGLGILVPGLPASGVVGNNAG